MIKLENVDCGYGGIYILKDLSCEIPENGVTLVTGGSGSGKSTLLKLMAGMLKADRGSVSGLSDKRISAVFQEDRLLPWFSALTNVAVVNDSGDAGRWIGLVELDEYKDKRVTELSGGQQRRVAIARALNFGGDVLLLDEPFTGLDDALKLRLIQRIRGEFPTIVIATHDASEAEALGADTRIELRK